MKIPTLNLALAIPGVKSLAVTYPSDIVVNVRIKYSFPTRYMPKRRQAVRDRVANVIFDGLDGKYVVEVL